MKEIYCKTRVTLRATGQEAQEGHGFGRGVELLLTGIEEHGSLNRTTKEMGMAYSKAWRILRQAEEEFGVQLVERDGAHGSTLTEDGRYWLAHYREMVEAAGPGRPGSDEKVLPKIGNKSKANTNKTKGRY